MCGCIRHADWDSNCIFLEYESDTLYLSRTTQFLKSISGIITQLHSFEVKHNGSSVTVRASSGLFDSDV